MTNLNQFSPSATLGLWESPTLIPVLRMIVKERITQWERQCNSQLEKIFSPHPPLFPHQQVRHYLALCQHWKRTSLNERQLQWLDEIETCLRSYKSH
jgi:hypothetical protein